MKKYYLILLKEYPDNPANPANSPNTKPFINKIGTAPKSPKTALITSCQREKRVGQICTMAESIGIPKQDNLVQICQ